MQIRIEQWKGVEGSVGSAPFRARLCCEGTGRLSRRLEAEAEAGADLEVR